MSQTIVTLTKTTAKVLAWVARATSTDQSRPVLTNVHINGRIEAADGYKAHWAAKPADLENLDGLYQVGKPKAGANIIETNDTPYTYPDLAFLMPRVPDGGQQITFAIDPKRLRETLADMDAGLPVRIKVMLNKDGTCTNPIYITGTVEDAPVEAILMPMYITG